MAQTVRNRHLRGISLCEYSCWSAWVVLAACSVVFAPVNAQQSPSPAATSTPASASNTLTIKLASVQWASTCRPEDGFIATQGAPVWCANSCASLRPGLQLAMQKLQGIRTPVTDITGATYNLEFTLLLKDHMCNISHYGLMMQQLVQRDRPHFYIQGLARTVDIDNAVTAAAGRILVQAVPLSDVAVARKPDTVFAMMPGTARAHFTLVKAMAANGIRNLALGVAVEGLLSSSYCGNLPAYAESLKLFAPGFVLSRVMSYNSSVTSPPYVLTLEDMVRQAAAEGVEALLFCSAGAADAAVIQDAVRRSGAYFKAVFIQHFDTDGLAIVQSAGSLGSAEGYLSHTLWDADIPYFDEVLGHASTYAADFMQMFRRAPVFYSAFASASVVVIRNAVQLALQMCNLSNAAEDMEAFMFNASYSVCRDTITGLRTSLSVYQLIYNRLATSYIETVAGPVGFNRQGVNDQLPPPTMQVQNGSLKVVYPLEVANAPLIMPLPAPPPPPMPPRPPQPQVTIMYSDQSWASSGTGIAVIVSLCVGVPLLVAALTFNWCFRWHRAKHSRTLKDLVTIPSDQLLVRCPPQQGQAGTGTYKHSLAVELLCMVDNKVMTGPEASQASRRLGAPLAQGRERSVSWLLSKLGGESSKNDVPAASAAGSSRGPGHSRVPLAVAPALYHVGPTLPTEDKATTSHMHGHSGDLGRLTSHERLVVVVDAAEQIVAASRSPGGAPVRNASVNEAGGRLRAASVSAGAAGPGLGAGSEGGNVAGAGTGARAGAGSRVPALTDKQVERMAEHVWMYMRIPHERLVPIHGIAWDDASASIGPLLVSERPELGTLASVLANDLLEVEVHTRANICLQVAEALEFMHSQNVFLRSPVMPTVHLAQGLRAKVSLTHLAQAWGAPPMQQDTVSTNNFARSSLVDRNIPNLSSPHARRNSTTETPGVRAHATGTTSVMHRREDIVAFGSFLCHVFRHLKSQSGTISSSMDSAPLEESLQEDLECVPELLHPLVRQCLAAKAAGALTPGVRRTPLASRTPRGLHATGALDERDSGRDSGKSADPGAGVEAGVDSRWSPAAVAGLPKPEFCMADVVATLRELTAVLVEEAAAQGGQVSSSPAQLANMVKYTQRNENMLSEFFPPKVARQLQLGLPVQPEPYEEVAIFFSDICGYTQLCSQLNAAEVMDLLHRLYTSLDAITRELRLFKVETIGDAYMAVSNIKVHDPDAHARSMAIFAFSAVEAASSTAVHLQRPELGTVNIRVGLHAGPVVASVVGTLNRRYCLFGDAVNVAARMESTSERNQVHCSREFAKLISKQWPQAAAESRGLQDIKGKGQMETFFLRPPKGFRTIRGTSQSGHSGHAAQTGQVGQASSASMAC